VEQKTENDNITEKKMEGGTGSGQRAMPPSGMKTGFCRWLIVRTAFSFLIPACLCGVNQEQPTPSKAPCLFCKNLKKMI
jgi:hypothetical protein